MSNSENVLLAVPEADREIKTPISFNPDDSVKTLGILWYPAADVFNFSIKYDSGKSLTKRFVFSTIARIYDPLGLLGPIIVRAKIFMRQLWLFKLNWDDVLPLQFQQKWSDFVKDLVSLSSLNKVD